MHKKSFYIGKGNKNFIGESEMKKIYEMVTLKKYLDTYDVKCVNPTEKEIEKQIERYLLNKQRNETNAKTIEALLV